MKRQDFRPNNNRTTQISDEDKAIIKRNKTQKDLEDTRRQEYYDSVNNSNATISQKIQLKANYDRLNPKGKYTIYKTA